MYASRTEGSELYRRGYPYIHTDIPIKGYDAYGKVFLPWLCCIWKCIQVLALMHMKMDPNRKLFSFYAADDQ